jgi:hypothetical protein
LELGVALGGFFFVGLVLAGGLLLWCTSFVVFFGWFLKISVQGFHFYTNKARHWQKEGNSNIGLVHLYRKNQEGPKGVTVAGSLTKMFILIRFLKPILNALLKFCQSTTIITYSSRRSGLTAIDFALVSSGCSLSICKCFCVREVLIEGLFVN